MIAQGYKTDPSHLAAVPQICLSQHDKCRCSMHTTLNNFYFADWQKPYSYRHMPQHTALIKIGVD